MKKVEIYTTSTCPDCKAAKEFFVTNNIGFIEHNIEEDSKNMDKLIEVTGKHIVPTIIIEDEIFIGFSVNREKVEAILLR